MLPQLPPPALDEEPLLRRPLLLLDTSNEDEAPKGRSTTESEKHTLRRHRHGVHYSSSSRSIFIRLSSDRLVKVTQQNENDEWDSDSDEQKERRLQARVLQFGACGLRVCGHNVCWGGISAALKIVWAYYFFNWAIIFLALAVCTLISIVYEALETGDSLGQAAIVVGLSPVISLLWLFFSFVYNVLFWGVWEDFFDMEASLAALRGNLQSTFSKNCLTTTVTFCINVPVLFSLVVFGMQLKKTASGWLWRTQFFLSFASNVLLAFLFFAGALIGQDHSILKPCPRKAPTGGEKRNGFPHSSGIIWGCIGWCRRAGRVVAHGLLHTEASRAVRIYVRSTIDGGGALSNKVSTWGRYAAQSFLPEPVDLEGGSSDPYQEKWREEALEPSSAEEPKNSENKVEDEEDIEERRSYQRRRRLLSGHGVKPWPTPWHLGWYCVQWCGGGRSGARLDERRCFPTIVSLPWTLLLLSALILLAYTAVSVRAYVLFAFIISYFMAVPLLHAVLARLIALYCSPVGLLALDVALTLCLVTGFLLCLSLASYYLGAAVIVVILLSNCLVLLAHIPAIRDRKLPPPRTHEEGLAFHTKARTHAIVTTARKWTFASIIFLLLLVLTLRTVPENYQAAHAAYRAARGSWKRPPSPANHRSNDTAPRSDVVQAPQPYAFCEQTFSRDRLSVLDLAHVSNAAYMEQAELQSYLAEHVPRHHFSNVSLVDLGQYGPVTYMFDLPHSRVLVWGIRGTNALFDLFQDLDAYSEAILIQLCTSLFPLYASPMFQPLLNKFVGTPSHLVETLATLKGVLLNHHLGGQRFSDSRSTGSSHGTEAVGNAVRYYYDALSKFVRVERAGHHRTAR